MSLRVPILLIAVILLTGYINLSFAVQNTLESAKPKGISQNLRYLTNDTAYDEEQSDSGTTRNENKNSAGIRRLTMAATPIAATEERAPTQVLTKVESSIQKTGALAKQKPAFLKRIGLTKIKALFQFQKQPAASKLTSFLEKKPSLSEAKTFVKSNPDVTKLTVDSSTKLAAKDVKRLRPFFSRVFGNDSLLWDFLIGVLTPAVFLTVFIIIAVKIF
ncbi:Putative RxLR effector [Phytophthora palmivora]|uniref:RxLR effector n=1 Tax=Phytophthora palmivora TaxID=4796 RepID=A0A2P4XZL7_9STRA|nr:Putative RxLR effector [Phytophthora palmivora]